MTPTILLVESNPIDVDVARQAFAEASFENELIVARTGEEALTILRQEEEWQDQRRPALVLLDLSLPGINGRGVLAAIKRDPELRAIPVVVLSSSNSPYDVTDAYQLAANAFVRKPVSLDHFGSVVALVRDFWLHAASLPRTAAA